jgi:hypothetical protein
MGQNFTFISNYVVPSNTNTVTLTGIPSTYSDLLMVVVVGNDSNENQLYGRPNSDTGGNKNSKGWSAYTGSAAFAPESTNQGRFDTFGTMQSSNSSQVFGMNYFYIKDYASTSLTKTMWSDARVSGGGNQIAIWSLEWNSTTAISSYRFNPKDDGGVTNFVPNCTFTLYGITID